jgi:hypothetical protein
MRCILGLVLCFVFVGSGLQGLYIVGAAMERSNNPGVSQQVARAAGWKMTVKYHAVVYAVALAASIGICALPTVLAQRSGFDEEQEWRRATRGY